MKEPTMNAKANYLELTVDEKIFSREISVATAYRFIDRCYVKLERAGRAKLAIKLKGKKKLGTAGLIRLADEFRNELLQQLMRSMISQKTSGLREVLVGRALLSSEPQENQDQSASDDDLDYLDDPLGIAIPWEEKYGDEKQDTDGDRDE